MERIEFQQLAELRLTDAEVLLAGGQWAAAYYLLGYCVECALKACIAKRFRLHDVPDPKFVRSVYTHDLGELLKISELEPALDDRAREDPRLDDHWETVRSWRETIRYDLNVSEAAARAMYQAVSNNEVGILAWLKTHW